MRKKCRFSYKQSAQEFLNALNFCNDEVKTRLADIDNAERFLANDIYYHSNCKKQYLRKYYSSNARCILCDDEISSNKTLDIETTKIILQKCQENDPHSSIVSRILGAYDDELSAFKTQCFIHAHCKDSLLEPPTMASPEIYSTVVRPIIENMLDGNFYLSVSDIRDELTEHCPEVSFYNHKIKSYLLKEFSDKVSFCKPIKKNESEIVYSSSVTSSAILAKLNSLNVAKKAGEMIRTALQTVDFMLEDSFCDSNDLNDAWDNTQMPEVLAEFFTGFYNIRKSDLIAKKYNHDDDCNEPDEDDEDASQDIVSNKECSETTETSEDLKKKEPRKPKIRLANSMFQSMFYGLHSGRKKTPLHTMMAHHVYDICKSKELMTTLNRFGYSISYSEYRRCREKLSNFTLSKNKEEKVPFPCHLNRSDDTIAAIDNFDHEDRSSISGMYSSHDSMTVLFQTKGSNHSQLRKPKISQCSYYSTEKNVNPLNCQVLETYIKPSSKQVPLPSDFPFTSNPKYEDSDTSRIISAARNCCMPDDYVTKSNMTCSNLRTIPSWSGTHALISKSNLPLKVVGFLPVLPHPITKHETVYTLLVNLDNIAQSLDQEVLPFFSDEGVYQYVVDIYLDNPGIFKRLFPMLGGFHMAKAACRCAGKYLRGSGIEDALIEPAVFGPTVCESVLNGSHYYRSTLGLLMIEDSIQRLKWEAFWEVQGCENYEEEIVSLCKLQTCLSSLHSTKAKTALDDIQKKTALKKLLKDFDAFSVRCTQQSEMCLFWENFLKIVETVKNLIKSEREGDFLLYQKTVGDLLPIFTGGDGIQYVRCTSFYHELLKDLKTKHPSLYQRFMKGGFVVKTSAGVFNAVSPDMKLEQTIQRSSKSRGGIIGEQRSLEFVTQWQLLYHEVLEISNNLRDRSNTGQISETSVHHNLSKKKILHINENIGKIQDFLNERGNPYLLSQKKLQNISSQVIAQEHVAQQHLQFFELTQSKFSSFRNNVFGSRDQFLGDKITMFKLLPVDHISSDESNSSSTKKTSIKDIKMAEKLLNIASEKCGGKKNALRYDITPYNYLYDGDLMTKTVNKSQFMEELEQYLIPTDYNEEIPSNVSLLVDFMSFIRSQVISHVQFTSFGQLSDTLFIRCRNLTENHLMHIIFDSYRHDSLKGPERDRRGSSSIELAKITRETPIPRQINKFWSSTDNKVLLQNFISAQFLESAKKMKCNIVLSGILEDQVERPCQRFISDTCQCVEVPELKSCIEEADHRIIPHINWSLLNGMKSITVVSSDTDVLVLLIHYYKTFSSNGLQKLWLRVGKGDKRRFIPVHNLVRKISNALIDVILPAYVGTGCDYISRLGTKHGALEADPAKYLTGFLHHDLTEEEFVCKSEEYLVKVLKKNSAEKTFDGLRYEEYLKGKTVLELPPTSYSIVHGHFPRWYYIVKDLSSLLDPVYRRQDPTKSGWRLDCYSLIPDKKVQLLPEKLSSVCSCQQKDVSKRCSSKRCKCNSSETACTQYCGCQRQCANQV